MRFCKFQEVGKHTPEGHPDHQAIKDANRLMQTTCQSVNEAKRQLEELQKLEDLQNSIANWEVTVDLMYSIKINYVLMYIETSQFYGAGCKC